MTVAHSSVVAPVRLPAREDAALELVVPEALLVISIGLSLDGPWR
jgi:hypothetical protein